MNFQQLRSVRETVRRGFNLTLVAEALHTSQPGISRQIRDLEEELGLEIFIRSGKRLLGLTAPGEALMPIIDRVLQEADNLRRVGDDFADQDEGTLTIAATHSQARYALPPAVRDFRALHPRIKLRIRQAAPDQVVSLLLSGEADVGVATEAIALHDGLVTLPCYQWSHAVIVPHGHALTQATTQGQASLTLATLARHPIITYEPGFTGRRQIDEAFAHQGLTPEIVLEAMDADVIKTYVDLGLGVGIVAAIAVDDERDSHLTTLDARHLFPHNMTRIGLRRGNLLRGFVYDFIESFAPPLTRNVVTKAMLEAAHSPTSTFDI
jgi:LysR family transcriptional regulator, cys regulon transcriptional activator